MSESYSEFMWGRGENSAPQTLLPIGACHQEPIAISLIKTYGIEITPLHFWNIAYTLWFCLLNFTLPRIIKVMFPNFYKSLEPQKLHELPSWSAGLFHHLIIAPVGFYMIYKDYITPSSVYNTMDYSKDFYGLHTLAYAFGYIMADTLFFTIPEIIYEKKFVYALHHVASLGLYWGLLGAKGAILRYVPHFMICESSNAIFNICFFLRNCRCISLLLLLLL